jgi:hypothetical protein
VIHVFRVSSLRPFPEETLLEREKAHFSSFDGCRRVFTRGVSGNEGIEPERRRQRYRYSAVEAENVKPFRPGGQRPGCFSGLVQCPGSKTCTP